jgi:hypothetical protein
MPSLSAAVASQITNEGEPNALKLGDFLEDPETKAVMRDKYCVKTLSFKASLHDSMYLPKAEAIANSFNWNFEEPESGDDADPPAAAIGVFDKIGDVGSPKPAGPSEPPATVAGGKRKARA